MEYNQAIQTAIIQMQIELTKTDNQLLKEQLTQAIEKMEQLQLFIGQLIK